MMANKSNFSGLLEQLSARVARGWAWEPNAPDRHVEVAAFYKDVMIVSTRADQFRRDLEMSNVGSGDHGFTLDIPEGLIRDEHLQLKVVGSPEALEFLNDAYQGGIYEGYVECISSAGVFGWVWKPRDPFEKVDIVVRKGGEIVSTATASVFRGDLYAAKIGDGRHAFWAKLNREFDFEPLVIQVAGTNISLPLSLDISTTPHPMWFTTDLMASVADADIVKNSETQDFNQATEQVISFSDEKLDTSPVVALAIHEHDHRMSREFDEAFYRARNGVVFDDRADPFIHFATFGWRQGRSPNAWFSVINYLTDYHDVLLSGHNPFLHYLRDGRAEGRKIEAALSTEDEEMFRHHQQIVGRSFEAQFYAEQLKTIDFKRADPLLHYMLIGWRQQVDPCPWFSIEQYVLSYPDVRAADIDPFFHYLSFGKAEGRQPTRRIRDDICDEFDIDFYLSQNPPLRGLEPIDHFVAFGWQQGYNPRADFDVAYYLRMNPDVENANMHPFWHYVVAGKSEKRPAFPKNSRKIAPNTSLPKLLFVGHDAIHAGAEVVLLEVIKWFANHTRYPIKLLLLGPGGLVPQYSEYADTHVMIESLLDISSNKTLQKFLNDKFSVCYVNTVASSRFWQLIDHFPDIAQTPLILHVHEMEAVIRDFETDFKKIIPYVNSMIAVSAAVRNTLVNIFDCDADRILLSNAFVQVIAKTSYEAALKRQAARLDLQLSSSDFVIVGCGTVYHRKGPDLFVDVAFKSIERSSIPNAKFVWIGNGDDIESLRGKVAARGLNDRIRFLGVRDNANELIAAADVFFLSSREDPFPLVCLEAAQYGIPTVYFTGATGISEFCGNTAGVGVKAFDTNAALQAISLYYSQPSRLEKAGTAARAKVLGSYTAEKRILEVALHLQKICHLLPSVSVIVPAYNHENFIRDRIQSILSQTIRDIEVIILDDCSSDKTVVFAQEYLSDPRVHLVRNEVNSGSPFIQWSKGAQLASSELVWIAEGDDLATKNFLAATLPAFDDALVNLAFCRTEIIDEFGVSEPGALDAYYKMSDFPFHGPGIKMDGLTAIESGFGSMCLIVNGSSTIIRRQNLINVAAIVQSYKMCGDWFVYLSAISDAKLVYVKEATNFFRRHSASAVHELEGTPQYFDERARIANYVVDTFNLSRRAFRLLTALLDGEWTRFASRNPDRIKEEMFDSPALLKKYFQRQNKPSLKIGFYVHGMLFSKGGIERLASQLANGLSNFGHSIYFFCRDWGGARPVYSLNESITIIDLFNEDDISRTTSALRIALAKCDLDVFVPMLSEWLFEPLVDACHGLGIPIIASEHNDPDKIEELWWSRPRRLACFDKVDAIHLLLDRFHSSLPETFQDRIYTIPNGVVVTEDNSTLLEQNRPKRIIGVGRLERQKRFDRLVKAFIAAADSMPGWFLDIYGEGSERNMLQQLIDQSGNSKSITLRGTSQIISAELAASSIFVLPSEFEGFGIVILEAKNAGLPCIGYADCNGPNDLIRHEVDGLLVCHDEDGSSLAAALRYLATQNDVRQSMGIAGREDVKRFNIQRIVKQWEAMLVAVAKPKADKMIKHQEDHLARRNYSSTKRHIHCKAHR